MNKGIRWVFRLAGIVIFACQAEKVVPADQLRTKDLAVSLGYGRKYTFTMHISNTRDGLSLHLALKPRNKATKTHLAKHSSTRMCRTRTGLTKTSIPVTYLIFRQQCLFDLHLRRNCFCYRSLHMVRIHASKGLHLHKCRSISLQD